MNKLLGLIYGFSLGAVLATIHIFFLWLWNGYLHPFIRRLLASEGRYSLDEQSLHIIDLVPLFIGAWIYFKGIAVCCSFAAKEWPAQLHAGTAAWTAFSISLITSVWLSLLLIDLANSVNGFQAFLMVSYALAMGGASGLGAYLGARVGSK